MGYTADGPLTEQILNETADFPELLQDIQLFLKHMEQSGVDYHREIFYRQVKSVAGIHDYLAVRFTFMAL